VSLLLAIESSSNVYRVVIGRDGEALFDSTVDHCESSLKTLGTLFSCGLEALGVPASEIKGIAINVGPGSLTFVRAGISFVNALAFSLQVDIYPFNWFEIVAVQTRQLTELPVVGVVPASNDNAYAGLIKGESVEIMRFGPVQKVVVEVAQGRPEIAVAGRIRQRVAGLLNETQVFDTGVETPDARTLLRMAHAAWRRGDRSTTHVEALNDQSDVFFATDLHR
jgi:tRNA A37 threonylcarbamoyladenosine modification protein TsaB